jgi:hypothetical protein
MSPLPFASDAISHKPMAISQSRPLLEAIQGKEQEHTDQSVGEG